MSQLSKRYDPSRVENRWYSYWEEQGYFHSEPDDREPFSVVIPPPNVTGVLHMGHMLNNTIQDVLIRKARLEGKNACWVPGTDHASIATEAKVVGLLREKGIRKSDIGREEFMKYAWDWRNKYGGIILEQLKKLGASCDWKRTAFTMDEIRSEGVIRVFVDLYRKGKIYRGLRMINWDPGAKTVLSNEEVLYEEEQSELVYVKYRIVDSEESIVIATQRPETIMGDTAVAVHPEDPRYIHLKGKKAIIPLVNRHVPIIMDEYVDREFGTGAVKITPAHDPNDYQLGLKHNLEIIDTLNEDGTLNEKAEVHIGLDRFEARKKVIDDLKSEGLLVKKEKYVTNIGRSERTHTIVEPKLSLQWYVNMKALAKPALDAVLRDEIEFFPEKYKNVYRHWMENIRDWCISRQLWWGHRIPAWYYNDDIYVAKTEKEALELARQKTGKPDLKIEDLKQDEDVLDTWFSSWLWPITVFDGFQNSKDIAYYYPTSVLVTAWDIIFLWVARMIMAGFEWKEQRPFKQVYFTGMVRDSFGRRMSKSLGNSPDALKLIEEYGADGVRYGLLSCSPAGGDLLFDEKLCETGRNFCNKIWNALRLVDTFQPSEVDPSVERKLAIRWLEHNLNQQIALIQDDFRAFRLAKALKDLYSFIWNDFCSWYLEMIKPAVGNDLDRTTYIRTKEFFKSLMTLLHPFMPFITEEIWQQLNDRQEGGDCIVSRYPDPEEFDEYFLKQMDAIMQLITDIRDLRNANQMKMRDEIVLFVEKSESASELFQMEGTRELVMKMAHLSGFDILSGPEEIDLNTSFLSGKEKYFTRIDKTASPEEERANLMKELEHTKGFIASVEKKLANDRFIDNAPPEVVDKERKKLKDGMQKIRILEENLENL